MVASDNYQCAESDGLGYWAVLYFFFAAIFGGMILPTVLVGVIAISWDKAWSK